MSFSQVIRKNLKTVIVAPLIVAVIVLIGSIFITPLYKSSLSLMIVQQQTTEMDARAAVQSAEQMADILSRVIESENFRSQVLASKELDLKLSAKPWERSKEWSKYVKTRNITDTGILIIDTYQPSSSKATTLASVIQSVLINRGYDYLGVSQETVTLRQLNPPSPANNKPATPNLLLNTVIGWLFGLIIILSILLIFPDKKWDEILKLKSGNGGNSVDNNSFTNQNPEMIKDQEINLQSGIIYQNNLETEEDKQEDSEPPMDLPVSSYSNFVSRANDILRDRS